MRNLHRMHLACWAVFLLGTLLVHAETPHLATVAPFAKAPVIDGKMAAGEWDGAVGTTGFQNIQGGYTDVRMGTSYFGFTNDRLYFAMVSELPPNGKLAAGQKNRDSEVIWDEGVEIWLDPNRDTRASGEGDLRYYNFMGNSIGTILDVRFDPKKGAPDMGWNANWEVANSIDEKAGVWVMELSVPVSDLGWQPGKVIGKSIGVLIARNYKAGGWLQATWFPHQGAFVGWFEYPRIFLTKDSPSVTISTLGDKVFSGQMALQARVFNPGPARKAQMQLHITSSDMPELKEETTLDLPAHGAVDYRYAVPTGRLHEEAQHTLSLLALSEDGKTPYLNYAMKWMKAPANKWPGVFTGPNPDAAVMLAYYPSYRFIRVFANPAELGKEAEAITTAQVTLTAPDGKELLSKPMTWTKAPATQEFPVPDLADGEYRVTVQFAGWKDPITRVFTRKHYPWEGNTLGITDKIYPPFLPITVKGREVGVVLRKYQTGGLGLWDSVQTVNHELLAGPIALKIDKGAVLKGTGKFTDVKPHAVVYEGRAAAPTVQVKTRCTTEYDGCLKVEVDLLPGKKKEAVKALWLEIPIKDAEARLWHCATTGLRNNPAGATPAGEGDVWNSTQYPDGNWYGNFKCYLWLGGEERGLCWFADNDRGWVLDVQKDKQAPCLVLHREKGVLTLRVNLIQQPFTITEPRQIVFGLMASPAKPMPSFWRKLTQNSRNGNNPMLGWMGSEYWGANENCASKYPRNHDFSILDAMRDARLGKPVNQDAVIKAFDEKNFQLGMAMGEKTRDDILNLLRVSMNMAANVPKGSYYSVYWDEFHSTDWTHEEVKTFQNEWSGNFGYGSVGGEVPSHRDFAAWYAAEFIKRGLGLYFDNAFPKRAYDTLTTAAYRLPNGEIQPSASMWSHRAYLKRIWLLHRELGPTDIMPMMMIHMTNTHIIPYMVWNDANLDLEWFYGPEPAQAKYPHELLRAESLGLQSGNIPLALARVLNTKSKEEEYIAERTRAGAMMVHEIKPDPGSGSIATLTPLFDFGYGEDDCTVYNYWHDNYPVKSSNDTQVKSLLLQRRGELLLLLCTWNPKPETVTLTLNSKSLVLSPTNATDVETKAALPYANNTLTVPLDGYGVRMIRLK